MKNLLEKLSLLMLAGALILTTSCGDDGDSPIVDEGDPTITLNSPANGAIVAAGSQVASSISFSDDIELSSVSITIGNGTVTILDVEETEIASTSFSFTENLAIPTDVMLGEHTVTVEATDASGNTASASATITALPAYTDGETTIMVEKVPAGIVYIADDNTNNLIHMVGSHQGWDPTSGSNPLSAHTDSEGTTTYFVQIANTDGVEGFKFVRGIGGWDFGEKGAFGEEIDNRTLEAGLSSITLGAIESWKDYNPDVQDNSSVTVIAIDGTLTTTEVAVKGTVVLASTTQASISTADYSVLDAEETVVASGSVSVEADGSYNETVDISGLALGSYEVQVLVTDAAGHSGRGDASLTIVDFPCDDSEETAVASGMTRIIVNVPSTTDDLYATGDWASDWGVVDDAYKLTRLSDECYYIDLALTSGQLFQVFRSNSGYTDWWKGQATNTPGSDATATYTVEADSDGSTVKLYYGYWREDPAQ